MLADGRHWACGQATGEVLGRRDRHRLFRAAQRGIEFVAATRAVDAQTRQVVPLLSNAGLTVAHYSRSRGGTIERVVASKP